MPSPHKYPKHAPHTPANVRQDWIDYHAPAAVEERRQAAAADYRRRLDNSPCRRTAVRSPR